MEIIRDGVKITLTFEERDAAYREAKAEYMRENVETIIKGICGNSSVEIPEKVKRRLTDRAAELYENYENKSDDWHYNCTESVRNAISELAAKIGKRKARELIYNCC